MTGSHLFFNRPLFSAVPKPQPSSLELPLVGDFVEFQFFSLGKEFGFFRGLVLARKGAHNFVIYDGFHGIFFNLSLANPALVWFMVLKHSPYGSPKNVSKFVSK